MIVQGEVSLLLPNAYLVTTKNLEAFLNTLQSARAPVAELMFDQLPVLGEVNECNRDVTTIVLRPAFGMRWIIRL